MRKDRPTPDFEETARADVSIANGFGLVEAIGGVVVGFVLSSIAVGIFAAVRHKSASVESLGNDVVNLFGLWVGFLGAAVLASRTHALASLTRFSWQRFRSDFGLTIRPWPDLFLGAAVGIGAQYLLVPLFELPLLPFVPHLYNRLGTPAKNLTGGVEGFGLVVLGVLICLGSPLIEEIFFRGLLLRSLLGRTQSYRSPWSAIVSVVVAGVLFGLLHFEALQLIGLIGFGIVLGVLALKTGRLGSGIVAHIAFNATTFIALAVGH